MPTLIMGPHSASVSLITTLPNTHLLTVDPCNCDDVFKAVCVCIYALVALITFAAYVFTGR